MKYSEVESHLLELSANDKLSEKERDFLFKQIERTENEIKASEDEIPKNFIKITLYTFIFLVIANSPKEKITIAFISIEEISLIEIFLPVLISFQIFRLWMYAFYRNSTSEAYSSLYKAILPNLYEKKIHEIFYPFSIRAIISKLLDETTGFVIRKISLLGTLILIYFTVFLPYIFLLYAYLVLFDKYQIEVPINEKSINFVFVVASLIFSLSFLFLSGGTFLYQSFLNKKESKLNIEEQESTKNKT